MTMRSIVEKDLPRVSSVRTLRRWYTCGSVKVTVVCPTGNRVEGDSSKYSLRIARLLPERCGGSLWVVPCPASAHWCREQETQIRSRLPLQFQRREKRDDDRIGLLEQTRWTDLLHLRLHWGQSGIGPRILHQGEGGIANRGCYLSVLLCR